MSLTCIIQEYSLLPHHQPFCHTCTQFLRLLAHKIPQFARLVPHYLLDLEYPPLQLPNPYFAQTNLCHKTLGLPSQAIDKKIVV
jgi:hypothetical protein